MKNFPKKVIIISSMCPVGFYGIFLMEYFSRIGFDGVWLIILSILLAGIAFVVSLIWGVLRRQIYGIRAFISALIMALPMLIFIPCNDDSCIGSGVKWIDFIYYRKNREDVIRLIRTGMLTPDDPEFPYVIIVPKQYGNVSGNANRVTFERGPGETIAVAFYLSSREYDIYTRSFCYTDIPSEVVAYEKLVREHRKHYGFQIKKYADHWYTSAVKHGYAEY